MGQLGFFDADKRLQALSARGDPLEAIDHLVPWESFRAEIEAVVLTPDELKKSSAGRKPFDTILKFRMLVLQALNNLSDEQVEYQVRDRLSFSSFLGLAIEDSIPDATTLRARIEHVFGAQQSALGSDRAHDWHGAGARQDRLAEPGLQRSPPGDAGTARRGMKVKSLSFNRSSGRDGAVKTAIKLKQHPTLCPLTRQNRPLFEVPVSETRSSARSCVPRKTPCLPLGVSGDDTLQCTALRLH